MSMFESTQNRSSVPALSKRPAPTQCGRFGNRADVVCRRRMSIVSPKSRSRWPRNRFQRLVLRHGAVHQRASPASSQTSSTWSLGEPAQLRDGLGPAASRPSPSLISLSRKRPPLPFPRRGWLTGPAVTHAYRLADWWCVRRISRTFCRLRGTNFPQRGVSDIPSARPVPVSRGDEPSTLGKDRRSPAPISPRPPWAVRSASRGLKRPESPGLQGRPRPAGDWREALRNLKISQISGVG